MPKWLPRRLVIGNRGDDELQEIVMTWNLTPRKFLGSNTPFQAILKELGKNVEIRFARECCASLWNPPFL